MIAAYRRYTLVRDNAGRLYQCQQRKSVGQVVSGDIVEWQKEDSSTGVITSVKERRTVLQRPDINGKLRIIAANIDQVFIVVAHSPALNTGLVDRYLVAAENSGIQPLIVLNKIDLPTVEQLQQLKQQLQLYQYIGYQVIYTSAKKEHGCDELITLLRGKNNIFVGQSGVGKSSLINTLLDNVNARTGEVSDATGKGKHTTTTACLYPLKNEEGYIIDSPGIREFGLTQISDEDVLYGFREFRPFIGECKFRNCHHQNEPGCVLLQAVKDGEISQQRWDSYQRIIASLE